MGQLQIESKRTQAKNVKHWYTRVRTNPGLDPIKEFKQKLNEIDKTKKSVEKMNEELTNAKKKMEQDKIRDINVRLFFNRQK